MNDSIKRTGASVIFVFLAQNLLAPLAMAQSFQSPLDQSRFDDEPRMMFYLSKGFGDSRKLESAPQLGLRFERSFQLDNGRSLFEPMQRPAFNQSLLDLRWTGGYGESLYLLGAPVYRSPLQLNSGPTMEDILESSGPGEGEEEGAGLGALKIVMIGALILGGMCLGEIGICKSSSSSSRSERSPGLGSGN